MADSFFGFDTSAPMLDGEGLEPSEKEYDALNDETFGAAINGDWENTHENLVRLDQCNEIKDDNGESDLELNLSRVGMDDFEVAIEDSEGRIPLDPSVWANPFKPPQNCSSPDLYGFYRNPDTFLRQNISIPLPAAPPLPPLHQQPQMNMLDKLYPHPMPSIPPHKIMSLEDIERNIRNQQKQLNKTPPKIDAVKSQTPQHQRQLQNSMIQQQFVRSPAPPGLPHPKGPLFQQQQLPPGISKQPRLPPGFPPMPMMGPLMGGAPHPNNIPRPMSHNLPAALNNFAMHPNFNVIRQSAPQMQQQRMPHLNNTQFIGNMQNFQNNVNQFNQRLVQEIQQNHPMLLPFNRMYNNYNNNMGNQHHMNANNQQQHMNGKQQMQQQHHSLANGNLNEEYDEYANLMSTRDKQWLISIQLSQLNTGTPYIDDYYYTVFKERKHKLKGERENKAHKDNQLNHPFSQPKGHAHLVLISMGNKNGNNQRNCPNNRERKTSESNKDKEQSPRTYTPLQFENSLGKLQCGSVTAPRKLIDMDIVGADTTNPFKSSIEISAQRKSKQILMHIESLYRIVLKLEDLENPTAIATSIIVKERKERERQLALFQQMMLDNVEHKDIHGNINLDSAGNSLRSSVSFSEKEEEGRDDLLPKLIAGLTPEKVAQMMTVRKGKTLLMRVMPLIKDHIYRWEVWYAMFSILPLIIKKDKDDIEGILCSLFPEFKKQIQNAKMVEIIKLGNSILAFEKKINIFLNKFCISCIIVLILRAEYIYSIAIDTMNSNIEAAWLSILTSLVNSISNNSHVQTLGASIQNDIIKPLVSHFSRFRELKSQQLLAVLTQETI